MVKIKESEVKWLESRFPNLRYNKKSQKSVGELDFSAAYDTQYAYYVKFFLKKSKEVMK